MPKLLSNYPVGKDLLESQSQENVAIAIINNLKILRLIGIDGAWGTGKSNLVGIIKNKLEKVNSGSRYFFYIYDAWGHQEDIHRRSLIEEVVNYVKNRRILKKQVNDKIDKEKDLVLGSRVITKTEVSAGFTWSTFFLLCGVVFSPITSGTSLSIIPLVCVGLALVFAIYNSIKKKCKSMPEFLSALKNELIGSYKKGDTNTEKTEYKNTMNPSTAAIKQFFLCLSQGLKDQHNLVIVVDNLARLPKEKVQEIWSTIQVCFASSSDQEIENIKVIVPFDREHLQMTLDSTEKKEIYANDFINKTFDVVFRVAAPVLSDWEAYFKLRWEEAFSPLKTEEEITEFDLIKRIYDAYTKDITPRDINAFINECVAIYLTGVDDLIKVSYIAVFVKKKSDILSNIVMALSDFKYLAPLEYLFVNNDDFPKAMAALAYQVPLETGIEVAIKRNLRNALNENKIDEVRQLAKIKTFSSILGEVLESPSGLNIPNMICALEDLDEIAFGGPFVYSNRWKMLWYQLKSYKMDGELLEKHQTILLKKLTRDDKKIYIESILEHWYMNNIINSEKLAQNLDEIENIVSDDINIWNMLKDYDVPIKEFIVFVEKYKGRIKKYKIKCDAVVIDEYLTSLPIENLENVKYIPDLIECKYPLMKYKTYLESEVKKIQPTINIFAILIKRLKEVKDKDIDISVWDIQSLNNRIMEAKQQKSDVLYDLLAIALIKFDYNTLKAYSPIVDYLNNDDNIFNIAVAKCIQHYAQYGPVLLHSEGMKECLLYKNICELLTDELASEEQKINTKEIIINFKAIVANTGIEKRKLANSLSRWNFEKVELGNIETTISKELILFTKDISDTDFVLFLQKCVKEYLLSLDKDGWKAYLEQGFESYGVCLGSFLNILWPDEIVIAIKEFFELHATNATVPGGCEEWTKLLKEVKGTGKNFSQTFGIVYDVLKNRKISMEEFMFWGDWLLSENKVEVTPNTLRRFVSESFLDNDDCMRVLLKHPKKIREIYDAAGEEQVDFSNYLEKLVVDGSQNARDLATTLNITVPLKVDEFEGNTAEKLG